MCDGLLEYIKGPQSVGESHNECQCDVETSDIALIEAAYELPDPPSSNRDRFVGHYLGADPQTVSLGWINGDPEVWGIHDFRCHLANHDRSMRFRERISLDNDCRPWFSIIPRRCNGNYISALHC